MKNKKSIFKKILLVMISLTIIFVTVGIATAFYLSSKVNRVEIDRTIVTTTGKEPAKEDKDVITIALFGTDYSESEKYGNKFGAADSTMILGIDTKNNKIKLFSLMRDMYLDMTNGEKQNLNYTMAYGGPESILSTINYNFNLTVDKFIHVKLDTLPEIIDKLDGIELNLTEEEAKLIKGATTGLQTLNGTQAVAYCRIRSTEGRDFKRTERHRAVLDALFNKFKSSSITELTSLLPEFLPLVSTNLSNSEILSIVSKVLNMDISNIEQARFPLDNHQEMIWTDMGHMIIDVEETTNEIHKFLYSLD